jgi:DNA invertase Pin-like site-specific DNA recombinase
MEGCRGGAYIARKTREDILRRTSAGRDRARAAGVKFGRKPKLSQHQRDEARARRAEGESPAAIAASLHVSASTILRLSRDPAAGPAAQSAG